MARENLDKNVDSYDDCFDKTNNNFIELYNKIIAQDALIASKADKAQPNWINATLQNGWTGTLQYRKNQIGRIEIRGDITAGTIADYTNISYLPAGYFSEYAVPLVLMDLGNRIHKPAAHISSDGEVKISPNNGLATGSRYTLNTSYAVD